MAGRSEVAKVSMSMKPLTWKIAAWILLVCTQVCFIGFLAAYYFHVNRDAELQAGKLRALNAGGVVDNPHKFMLTVKSHGSRRNAELAVLCAFAKRNPDGCQFHLRKSKPRKV